MIEPYPGADAPLLEQVGWWWAYGPMLLVGGIAIGLRVSARRLASSIQRKGED